MIRISQCAEFDTEKQHVSLYVDAYLCLGHHILRLRPLRLLGRGIVIVCAAVRCLVLLPYRGGKRTPMSVSIDTVHCANNPDC